LNIEEKHPVFLGYKNCAIEESTPANGDCHASETPGIALSTK